MSSDLDVHAVAIVFVGAAVLASLALYARQSLIVAYILLGVLFGPWGLGLVDRLGTIVEIGHVGIIFLLFLLGLNLHPQKLVKLLGEATFVTGVSSLVFAATGAGVALAFGFSGRDSVVVGVAMMFSSTIVGLKLLPTTALHHRHTGEVIISVLLLQDVIAIVALLFMQAFASEGSRWLALLPVGIYLPLVAGGAFVLERALLVPLMARFDSIQEYVFVAAIGWCLGIAAAAHAVGLSYETGAFIAGVALAENPVSRYIAESLKPLRDFFLIMFFFSLGAGFDLAALGAVAVPAVLLSTLVLLVKPWTFLRLLDVQGETPDFGAEVGARLGQASEFAMMIAVLAETERVIGAHASTLIQGVTLLSIIVSAYFVMLRYPTPIGVNAKLRRS